MPAANYSAGTNPPFKLSSTSMVKKVSKPKKKGMRSSEYVAYVVLLSSVLRITKISQFTWVLGHAFFSRSVCGT